MIAKRLLIILMMCPFLGLASKSGDSWKQILKDKKGDLVFYWYPNNIIIENSKDVIDGVEHDLAISFVNYLNDKYGVKVELKWSETNDFKEVISNVRDGSGGTFGASSISITEARKEYLSFTQPYLADVAVLVSNSKVPIAYSKEELNEVIKGGTAVSIENTTLNESLFKLKDSLNLDFDIEYVSNSGQVIDRIESLKKGFGYIDLSNFLVSFDNNSQIRRQLFYPVKLEGLAMIFPKESDWKAPVEDYFNSEQFKKDKAEIILRYLGKDITEIIDRISRSVELGPLEEIVISNREKELQYQDLLKAAQREKDKNRENSALIVAIIIALLVLSVLYINNRVKAKANELLLDQQKIIEERNEQLRALNEEKNSLIQVLAHDLRSPLSSIIGFSRMLKESENFSAKDHKMNDFESYIEKHRPNTERKLMLLKKGQVSFHSCLTLHASYPNVSDRNRMALAVHMQDADNTYQKAWWPDGNPVSISYDAMCAKDSEGNPDYSDPKLFPVMWTENA